MNFLLLEHCLAHVEDRILQLGVVSAISSLNDSTWLESFKLLKTNHNTTILLEQSKCSHSPLRASSILCLEISASNDRSRT